MEEFKFRSNQVILQGDTHSTSVTYDIIGTRVANGSDYVHLGDIGLGFGDVSYAVDNAKSILDRINKLCQSLDINCYFIRGNHDATYDSIWLSEWSNIKLIKDHAYAVFPNGKRVLMFGGGISLDRCDRQPNKDYWWDENTIPIDDVEKCDIIFSHDCPEQFNHSSHTIPTHWKFYNDKDHTLYSDCVNQRDIVGYIVKRSEATTIFYGHFHNNMTQQIDGVYARCVDINELYFFDADKKYGKRSP